VCWGDPFPYPPAEVVVGDLLEINTVRVAMEGVDAAYLVWPVQPGLIHATVNFAQAAKEAGVKTVINLSQRSANRDSTSNSCRDSFIAEEVLNWSGLPVIHLRPTYFLEWLSQSAAGRPPHAARQGTAFADRRGRSGPRHRRAPEEPLRAYRHDHLADPSQISGNSKGWWDWWGYSGDDYLGRDGKQMRAVREMIGRVLP
jgi:uncharacterized protein YbjT (DUF2867 family)